MANKKSEEIKNTTKKKNSTKNNTTKKTATTKSNLKENTNLSKKNTVKKNTTNNKSANSKAAKKTIDDTKKTTVKKAHPKKVENKTTKKNTVLEENMINLEEKIEFPNNYVNVEDNNISKQEKDEKVIVEEINNITKLENAKYIKNIKKRSLLPIGVVIAMLGLIALIISLIANRIVDREFLSDNAITLMLITSIIIEGFGAFIIINES